MIIENINSIEDSITASPPAGAGVNLKSILSEAKKKGIEGRLQESSVFKSALNADRNYLKYEQRRVCENCNKEDKEEGCCAIHCELFNDMYEATKEGFDINPCLYCEKRQNGECDNIENFNYSVGDRISIEAIKDIKPKIYELFKEVGIKELTAKQYRLCKNSRYETDYRLLNIARDKILNNDIKLGESKLGDKFRIRVKETQDRYIIKIGEKYSVYLKEEKELVTEKDFNKKLIIDILMELGIAVERVTVVS